MPAYSTHYIFAKEMMDELKKTADFEINENAVIVGTQGPDIFFFHRALPWQRGKTLRACGVSLHKAKCGDILDGFRYYLDICDNMEIALSYIYGFILHYALDRNCHPYVYALQEKIIEKFPNENPGSVHNTIEFSIDSYLLNKKLGVECPKSFRNDATLKFNEIEKAVIGEVLASVSRVAEPNPFAPIDVEIAMEDMIGGLSYMATYTEKKEGHLKELESLASPFTGNFKPSSMIRTNNLEKAEKYVNIHNGVWESPYEPGKRNESFLDLYEYSKKDALEMIEAFKEGKSGKEITNNISFLTGVEVL